MQDMKLKDQVAVAVLPGWHGVRPRSGSPTRRGDLGVGTHSSQRCRLSPNYFCSCLYNELYDGGVYIKSKVDDLYRGS